MLLHLDVETVIPVDIETDRGGSSRRRERDRTPGARLPALQSAGGGDAGRISRSKALSESVTVHWKDPRLTTDEFSLDPEPGHFAGATPDAVFSTPPIRSGEDDGID